MVKIRSLSWLIIGIFLFSLAFQVNYNGQIQTNFQNSLDSFQHTPMSLTEDEGEISDPHAIKIKPLNSLGEIEITHMDLIEYLTQDNFFPISSNIINYSH